MHGDHPSSRLERTDTRFSNRLLHTVDPFTTEKRFGPSLMNALLATALFRCYHLIFFFTAWATLVTLVNQQNIYQLNFQPTLLTVVGTVLGFVISYRTTSSFERYNEGRRLWSQIILNSRNFARCVWFHVPDIPAATSQDESRSPEELQARALVEKKTVVNLIDGFAVAVKHYLRGEEGCYYEDLWPLVKFLPAYALPAGLPSPGFGDMERKYEHNGHLDQNDHPDPGDTHGGIFPKSVSAPHLPLHVPPSMKKRPLVTYASNSSTLSGSPPTSPMPTGHPPRLSVSLALPRPSTHLPEEPILLPSRMPPKFSYFDVFPFSLLVKLLTAKGKEVKGRKAARLRAKMGSGKRGSIVSHNVPLEITLYLSSYIAALQRQKALDVPTANLLTASLNGLVDALTGLERILTTPIPFSYSIHLWVVTAIYCFALPLQIWKTMDWLTIPATSILTFIFFGFLVAGEEIENPFGYDKNDLNMDHFTHSIIRPELMAITSLPTPNPAEWAFSTLNDVVFDAHNLPSDRTVNGGPTVERMTPDEWVARGTVHMRDALSRGMERTGLAY